MNKYKNINEFKKIKLNLKKELNKLNEMKLARREEERKRARAHTTH